MEWNERSVLKGGVLLASVCLSGAITDCLNYNMYGSSSYLRAGQVPRLGTWSKTEIYGLAGAVMILLFGILLKVSVDNELDNSLFRATNIPNFADPYNFRKMIRYLEENKDRFPDFLKTHQILNFMAMEQNWFSHNFHGFNPFLELSEQQFKAFYEQGIKLRIEAPAQQEQMYICAFKSLKSFLEDLFLCYVVSVSRKSLRSFFFYGALVSFLSVALQLSVILFQMAHVEQVFIKMDFFNLGFAFLSTHGKLMIIKDCVVPLVFCVLIFYCELTFQDPDEILRFLIDATEKKMEDTDLFLKVMEEKADKIQAE